MQRNMDLVRLILMRLESGDSGNATTNFGIKGYLPEQIAHHAYIMMEEGLIKAIDVTTLDSAGPKASPTGLTWKGHEFLDLARDADRWNRAKAIIAKVGGAPISVWRKVLTDLMLQGVESATAKTV